jgi:hypothetical protein
VNREIVNLQHHHQSKYTIFSTGLHSQSRAAVIGGRRIKKRKSKENKDTYSQATSMARKINRGNVCFLTIYPDYSSNL